MSTAAARTARRPGALSPLAKATPFATAEEAWIWTMQALVARRDGARIVSGAGNAIRPCEPDDVVKCLDRLYRQRRIDLGHARVLARWGERGTAPDARQLNERRDAALWVEALRRLEWPLRVKGILAPAALPAGGVVPFGPAAG